LTPDLDGFRSGIDSGGQSYQVNECASAEAFIQLAENPEPPLHLWLGVNAGERAGEKVESMAEDKVNWLPQRF